MAKGNAGKTGKSGHYKAIWEMTEEWKPSRPKLTIEDILEIAGQIYKETGRYLSYGAVCTKIYAGHIIPEDYLGKRGRKYDKRRTKRSVAE